MTWFIEGGPWMYAILATDLIVGAGVALVLLIAVASRVAPVARWPARVLAALVLACALLPLLGGVIGWQSGLSLMEAAIAHASDEMKEAMRAQGEAIAMLPLYFGLGSSLVLGLGGLISATIAAVPHRAPTER